MSQHIAAVTPTVTLRGRELHVHGLFIRDAGTVSAAAAAVEAGHSLDTWLSVCIRAGAAASVVAANGIDLCRLERTVADLSDQAGPQVQDSLTQIAATVTKATGPDSELATAVKSQIDRLATGIGAILSEDGQVPVRIPETVKVATQETMHELQDAFATQAKTLSATVSGDRDALSRAITDQIASQQGRISAQLEELRSNLAAMQAVQAALHTAQVVSAAAPIASAGPGLDYEEAACRALSRIAVAAGMGGATRCGGSPGLSGTKLGDSVIELQDLGIPAPRIVIEAKRRSQSPTPEAARRELAGARANRGAHYAIMLAPLDRLPVPGVRLQVLTPLDLAVAWDPDDPGADAELTAALLLLRLVADHSRSTQEHVDAATLKRVTGDLANAITPIADILRHAGAAEASLGRLKVTANALHADLATRIEGIRSLLA